MKRDLLPLIVFNIFGLMFMIYGLFNTTDPMMAVVGTGIMLMNLCVSLILVSDTK